VASTPFANMVNVCLVQIMTHKIIQVKTHVLLFHAWLELIALMVSVF